MAQKSGKAVTKEANSQAEPNWADDELQMSGEAFRAWRKGLGWKQKDAADALGLKKRMIQYYETGARGGKEVVVPKSVRLACHALAAGVADYDGERTRRWRALPPAVMSDAENVGHARDEAAADAGAMAGLEDA